MDFCGNVVFEACNVLASPSERLRAGIGMVTTETHVGDHLLLGVTVGWKMGKLVYYDIHWQDSNDF